MKHIIDSYDLSVNEVEDLIKIAVDIEKNEHKYSKLCENKILSTIFFEPSTRTRLSFECAMLKLGGKVLGFSSAESSSAAKGEDIADTVRTISCYSDICVIRHQKEGSAKVASIYSKIPVINAGDGGHQHPTQTLTDIYAIYKFKNKIDDFTIGICGDLKFGRTVHSLINALCRHKNIKFVLISPDELRLPDYVKANIQKYNMEYKEMFSLEAALPELDILYMTRVQRERFFNEEDYIRLKDTYILNVEKMKKAKKDMVILHPMPRVNEIAREVDEDERAFYFKQSKCGVYIRMALILKLLNLK